MRIERIIPGKPLNKSTKRKLVERIVRQYLDISDLHPKLLELEFSKGLPTVTFYLGAMHKTYYVETSPLKTEVRLLAIAERMQALYDNLKAKAA